MQPEPPSATTRIALNIRTADGRRKTVCHFWKLNPADLPTSHPLREGGGFADNQWHVVVKSVRVRQFEPKDSEFAIEYYKNARDGAAVRGLPAVEENSDGFTIINAAGKKMFFLNRATLARVLDAWATAGRDEIDLDTLEQARGR